MINKWFGTSRILGKWQGDNGRPGSVVAMIADKPASIVIYRESGGTTTALAAQTVRLDLASLTSRENLLRFEIGTASRQKMLVTGYKGHPTVADTDIQYGDRFGHDGNVYRVMRIEQDFDDRVLALAEAID